MTTENKMNNILVHESGKGKFAQEVVIRNHTLEADEPVSNGGNDLGPSPYDFLLTALGCCTSMTVRMYADLKKIPLKNIIVRLTHEKIYAKDCAGFEETQSKIDSIQRNITLEGELTEEQRAKLLEIANKCPVHRTLTSKILINTVLGD